ncbi:hypothetical protein FGO68_gene10721 [Halteria grandinella]|uniref:Peptidoglycan binding-like domain-containing protein n=1 Tax=Halteria grandinella TaxID=5974 RepID=A0A8J8NQC8_HALGN|nr:hypothetical protein FGO68_gene10721 [Halteria grandinella]
MDAFPQAQQNPSSNSVLKKGSSGESVRELQEKLVQNGAKIQIYGKYGPATERAVRDYQATYGLQCDGIAGRNTFASINQSSQRPSYTSQGGLQSYGFSGSQSVSSLYTPQTSTQFLASLHHPYSSSATPPTPSQFQQIFTHKAVLEPLKHTRSYQTPYKRVLSTQPLKYPDSKQPLNKPLIRLGTNGLLLKDLSTLLRSKKVNLLQLPSQSLRRLKRVTPIMQATAITFHQLAIILAKQSPNRKQLLC